jgi:ribonuclease HI
LIIFFIVSILTIEGIKLKISVYVDGSGGSNSGFGFFVKETGESFYEKKSEITNNQAEYMAIILALKKFVETNDEITIYSDSKNTVNQLNHEFAINNEKLRDLARESWVLIAKFSSISIIWIPRKENLAGKMLGS